MTPFTKKEPKNKTLLNKIFGSQPKANAIIKINNLLADRSILDVSIDDVQTIALEHKINIEKKYRPQILGLVKEYLHYCLHDKHLSDQEIKELFHLKKIFNLVDKEISMIHKEVAGKIYKAEVDKVVADGRLEDSEVKFLEKLRNDLRLSEKFTTHIYKESAQTLVQKFMDNAVSDERLSPDEEEELQAICRSLGVNLNVDINTQATLDKYKLYWQIENGDLPTVITPINTQKSEQCHFHTNCTWLEQRRVTKRINYGGPTLRIKIAKGVYWRAGSLGVQAVSEDVWQKIDIGEIYLTNKRLIFMGSKGNKAIRLNKILDFTAYSNGVDIQKDSGKSPFIQFSNNTDIFAMILGRVMRDM